MLVHVQIELHRLMDKKIYLLKKKKYGDDGVDETYKEISLLPYYGQK